MAVPELVVDVEEDVRGPGGSGAATRGAEASPSPLVRDGLDSVDEVEGVAPKGPRGREGVAGSAHCAPRSPPVRDGPRRSDGVGEVGREERVVDDERGRGAGAIHAVS